MTLVFLCLTYFTYKCPNIANGYYRQHSFRQNNESECETKYYFSLFSTTILLLTAP